MKRTQQTYRVLARIARIAAISPTTVTILVLCLAPGGVAGLSGCGIEDKPTARGDEHVLDSPDLAGFDDNVYRDGIPVLCYHYFRAGFDPGYFLRVVGAVVLGLPTLGPKEFWTTHNGEFERHLRYFQDQGIAVLTLDQVQAYFDRGHEPPRPAVVLTIDDADVSVYELAYPLLQRYGYRAHLFVPTARIGQAWSGIKVCTHQQLAEMANDGTLRIDSHTDALHFKIATSATAEPVFWHPQEVPVAIRQRAWDLVARDLGVQERGVRDGVQNGAQNGEPTILMPPVMTGPYGPVALDLAVSRRTLRRITGRESTFLAWPYGFADAKLDSIAALVGFTGSVSLRAAPWRREDEPWHIGRYTLTAKTTLAQLARVLPSAVDSRPAVAATEAVTPATVMVEAGNVVAHSATRDSERE